MQYFDQSQVKIPHPIASRLIFDSIESFNDDESAAAKWFGPKMEAMSICITRAAGLAKSRHIDIFMKLLEKAAKSVKVDFEMIDVHVFGETHTMVDKFGETERDRKIADRHVAKGTSILLPALCQPLVLWATKLSQGSWVAGSALFNQLHSLLTQRYGPVPLKYYFFAMPCAMARLSKFGVGEGFLHEEAGIQFKNWVLDGETPKRGKLQELVDQYFNEEEQ